MTSPRTIFLLLSVFPLVVRPTAADAAVYADRQVVSNLTSVVGGQVNLYAGWAPNTYTVYVYHREPSDRADRLVGAVRIGN